jgi:hypothetical protein
MTPARKRLAMLFVAVGVGLIVERTLASGGDDDGVSAAVTRAAAGKAEGFEARASSARLAVPAAALRLDALTARRSAEPAPVPASDAAPLFAVQSWRPPPPPAPPPAADPEPEVPAFPYPYLGGLTDDAGRTAFFARGERVLAVRSGATIDGSFRIDQLDETAMTLTYLPLHKTVSVALGGRP